MFTKAIFPVELLQSKLTAFACLLFQKSDPSFFRLFGQSETDQGCKPRLERNKQSIQLIPGEVEIQYFQKSKFFKVN